MSGGNELSHPRAVGSDLRNNAFLRLRRALAPCSVQSRRPSNATSERHEKMIAYFGGILDCLFFSAGSHSSSLRPPTHSCSPATRLSVGNKSRSNRDFYPRLTGFDLFPHSRSPNVSARPGVVSLSAVSKYEKMIVTQRRIPSER